MQGFVAHPPEVQVLLLLIAVPVIVLVAFAHIVLQAYAPSNVLLGRVRQSRPTLCTALSLGALAFACALAVQAIRFVIESGAPRWLNLVVLVLAWDAIKFAVMACLTLVRRVVSGPGGLRHPYSQPVYP